jgi:hypothetical protein
MTTKRSVRVTNISFARCLVIVSCLNRRRAEDTVQIVSVRLLLNPFPDCVEHVPMEFKALVS